MAFKWDLGSKNSISEICTARRKVLSILILGRLMCPVPNTFNLVSVLSLTKLELQLLKNSCREKCSG